MIVMKFGGTSVQDATSMNQVLEIVKNHQDKQLLVVLSACSGVTDKLHEIILSAGSGSPDAGLAGIGLLEARHKKLIGELIGKEEFRKQAEAMIDVLLEQARTLVRGVSLLKECTPKSIDSCTAFGELLSTSIFYCAARDRGLDAAFADARNVMMTDPAYTCSNVDMENTTRKAAALISPELESGKTVITQGFIGSAPDGSTTTLGRGGSDYSAALFGAALGAREIWIWTDVNGILTTDPRLVPDAAPIPEISFAEVRELSFYGAKVLHPDTIKPAVNRKIPVRVLNTAEPDRHGTLILDSMDNNRDKVRSLVLKENCLSFKFEIPMNENSVGFLSEVLGYLKQRSIKALTISTSENNCVVVLEKNAATADAVSGLYEKYRIKKQEVSLLCLCGSGIAAGGTEPSGRMQGMAAVLAQFNPLSIIYGISDTSMLVILDRDNGLPALKAAHSFFITGS